MALSSLEVMNNVLSATVKHEQYQQCLEVFERVTALTERYGTQSGFLLLGPSGAGKTRLAKRMKATRPVVQEGERTVVPVLMISMPANPTIIGVCKLLLDELGQRYARNSTEADLGYQLKTILRKIGTCMLIIDEAQHLVDGKKIAKSPAMVADWIKQMMNDVQMSVTLVGVPRGQSVMRSNNQLARRFGKRVHLKGFSINNERERDRLNNVLAKIMSESGYSGNSDYLRRPSTLQMVYYATNGRLGYITALLAGALWTAVESGDDCLDRRHFETAFENEIWSEATPTTNPFSGKFVPRELVNIDEPFYEELT